ncbi:Glycosyltransferase involved in cell wall bisynthesis [Paenibacillus sp. yr247]|uniref:glycosyltransferase family 2 protein n=1 Tax=Paenibacillus sp. yr247 TaxID=1761880 RepID=UPI00088B039E|nr:glycosyltransferase family 2 protein [Paenibacillus sp. yr247]SDN35101.1 Glycosyltransferase involved in cell wall bisynthesis [Paenibacillus sp. yr247]
MNIWYVHSVNNNERLPIPLDNWLNKHVSKVFLHPLVANREDWFSAKEIHMFSEEQVPVGVQLGKAFARSYALADSILNECLSNSASVNSPTIIIIMQDEVLPYFILQHSWGLNPQLSNVYFITLHEKTKLNELQFQFPEYWIRQMEKQCIASSHYALTWDVNIFNTMHLKGFTKVKYLEPEKPLDNDWNKQLIKWCTDQNEDMESYPLNASIPTKINSIKHHEKILLSVIIPYYNLGYFLIETIESIISSTYLNLEIILVNDGSNDPESISILEEVKVKYKLLQVVTIRNQGLANARNVGAQMAKGQYISFLDADDKIEPIYFERCIQILNKYQNVSFVYSWVKYFGLKEDVWITFNTELPYFLLSNMLSAFAVIRKEDFLQYGMNKIGMNKGMEDYESWISMYRNGCAGVSIPEPLVNYRIRNKSMSRQFNRKIVNELYFKLSQYHCDLYEKYGFELFNLMNANGPGYLWNNPTILYPNIGFVLNEDDDKIENNIKYELMRIANSKIGTFLIELMLKLKINKLFK